MKITNTGIDFRIIFYLKNQVLPASTEVKKYEDPNTLHVG